MGDAADAIQAAPERAGVLAARARLAETQAALAAEWATRRDSLAMLKGRAAAVDAALRELWRQGGMPEDYALAAVGGYGRGELFPGSDVDLLILLPQSPTPAEEATLEQFVGLLWDVGLEIGHSVRTPDECLEEAERDITVKTALLEARHLAGAQWTYEDFAQRFRGALDPVSFLKAKQLEQAERYAKHNDTPYALEPNFKESPGGLRDLQVAQWIMHAAGIARNWRELASSGLIRLSEAHQLERCERRVRDLRVELHLLAGRREDRLLFDYQEKLAKLFGIAATESRRASEVLMQQYYRNAKRITQLNVLLVETIAERLLQRQPSPSIVIDDEFQLARELLDVRDEEVFERNPGAILRCFLLQMQRSEIAGMTPRTLRALWRARTRIDAAFRHEPAHRRMFLDLFRQKHLLHGMRRMNQYDILGRYLLPFGRIVGQMQHDLFHVYTVDQHILQVMRNLRRFAMPEFSHEYPFCSRLMSGFEKPWLLYLGALFHDIAKGRGGDHSKLGVADARRFCRDHGVDAEDTDFVAFLVEQHLTMSAVAQKQDLADPEVIEAFARVVGNHTRLVALYLLTVADIRGTSPKVWNAWKGKLLEDLFRMTARLLSGEAPIQLLGISERQEEARRLLRYHGLRPDIERDLWDQLDIGYFLRHDAEEIAWHTRILYHRPHSARPVVRARLNAKHEGLQIMVYAPDQPLLFSRLCGFFARSGFTIVDAKVHTTRHGYALDSFIVLNFSGNEPYRDVAALVEHDIAEELEKSDKPGPVPAGRLSRQVRHFPISPQVDIRADERGSQFLMTIAAADRPGLLYSVARILGEHGVQLHSAKIATLGERVEDVFLISGHRLGQTSTLVRLEQDLLNALQV